MIRRTPAKSARTSVRILLGRPRLPGRLKDHGVWHDCRIMDISPDGAKVGLQADLDVGDTVRLEIGSFGSFDAEIVWRNDSSLGLHFNAAPEQMDEVVLGLAVYG